MLRISYVKDSRIKGYITLGMVTDDGSMSLTVSKITYSSIGSPVRGGYIDDDVIDELRREDEEFRALRRALSILSYADNSRRTLEMKLRRAGFSRESCEAAARECISHGYINEDEQIARFIEREANINLRGSAYIRAKLVGKGYSSSDIDRVLQRLTDSCEVDFYKNFESLCDRRGITDKQERMALAYKYGYKRGF
jgi:SOS response regulatory protein OraA/RecX